MRSASSFRRAGGLVAVATLGMSTAVLSAVGVAQAAPVPFTTETPLTVPADTCTIRFVLAGGSGADVGGQVGGAGDKLTLDWVVYPGEQYLADTVTYAGGAGGTGGGAGGEGVGLVMDGELIMVAAGGGGAGSLADGGAAGGVGGSLPDLDEADGLYTWGGDPGGWSLPGNGGLSGPDVVGGFDGGAGVDSVGGDAGGPGAGGGGGGVFGGGAGASDGTDGAGGGGGYSEGGEPAGTSTGPAAVTYEYLACAGTEMPLAPSELTAIGGDEELTVAFFPEHHDSGENPHTWEYKVDAGSWTPVEPEYNYDNFLEFVIDGLDNGTSYTVQVRGVSENDVHGAPASVTGTPYEPIGAPSNVQVSTSATGVTFTWDAPTTPGTYALDGYVGVLAANNGESGGPVWFCENTAAERICEAPAAPGVNYEVFVTAVDVEGNPGVMAGPISAGKLAPPATVPPSDGPLQAPPGAAGGIGQGEKITITGSGYAPNTLVTILIYSEPQVLTTVWTDGSGSFTVEVTVPAGLAVGQHTLVAAGVDPSGVMRYLTLPVTVTETTAVLAYTGADIALPAFGGLAALAVGGGLLFAGRRRPVAAEAVEHQ